MLRIVSTLMMAGVVAATASAVQPPALVLGSASSLAQANGAEETWVSEHGWRDEYRHDFFEGLTHPFGGSVTGPLLVREAYRRGQAYWREHPLERTRILSEFGYIAVERERVWSIGSEKSVFEPADAPGESWWMSTFGDVSWSKLGLGRAGAGNNGSRVRIIGYLGPKGRYGHLGGYEREVLVTAAIALPATVPAPADAYTAPDAGTGNASVNAIRAPSVRTDASPPCSAMTACTIDKPSPVEPSALLRAGSAR